MKVVVTGSQGFIGSYICQELLDSGYFVVGIDNFSKYGQVSRPHDDHPNFSLFKQDICTTNFDQLAEWFAQADIDQDIDYIIAGAAMIGGISYFHKYAYDLLATNERILANTFDLALECFKHDNLKRIIVLSSSMVFENTSTYPTPESEITKCPPPASTYGFQKLSSEFFCKGAYEQYNLPYTIVRPFNCVGVGEGEALGEEEVKVGNIKMLMSHVLPDLIYKALNLSPKDKLPILGSGKQIRHYTNGKDIARGIARCMESPDAINEDFNISSPIPTSVEDLGRIVWDKVHGCQPEFEHHDPFPYDVQVRSPDTTKAKNVLGFETTIDIEDSVSEVIEYMKREMASGKL